MKDLAERSASAEETQEAKRLTQLNKGIKNARLQKSTPAAGRQLTSSSSAKKRFAVDPLGGNASADATGLGANLGKEGHRNLITRRTRLKLRPNALTPPEGTNWRGLNTLEEIEMAERDLAKETDTLGKSSRQTQKARSSRGRESHDGQRRQAADLRIAVGNHRALTAWRNGAAENLTRKRRWPRRLPQAGPICAAVSDRRKQPTRCAGPPSPTTSIKKVAALAAGKVAKARARR
jgi:hypothetical protein